MQARRFAQARGTRAKTDAVDARLLAEMGMAFGLDADRPTDETTRVLRELQTARQALVKDRVRLRARLETQTLALTRRRSRARLARIARQLAEIDRDIGARVTADRKTGRTHDILRSIPGLGAVSASAILTRMPEIGTLERKRAASLAGLAPMTSQSGNWTGAAFIQGGRKHLRDALYMPALTAMRFNPDLREHYQRLRSAGKPAKVALIALMRKLIELANALVKADRMWSAKRA